MNVSWNPQCVTVMQHVMTLKEAMNVHAWVGTLEMESYVQVGEITLLRLFATPL